MGRWDYGPWFWPPWTVQFGPVNNPYYDPVNAAPGSHQLFQEFLIRQGHPNLSWTLQS